MHYIYAHSVDELPTQEELDRAYDFLYEYHNTWFDRVFGIGLKPPKTAYMYMVRIPIPRDYRQDELATNLGYWTHTDKSMFHPDISYSLINLNIDRIVHLADSFWTEFAQILDSVGNIGSWGDILHTEEKMFIAEKRNNIFGIAVYSARLGYSYEQYRRRADLTGYAVTGEIHLVPYGRSRYEEVVDIFGSE